VGLGYFSLQHCPYCLQRCAMYFPIPLAHFQGEKKRKKISHNIGERERPRISLFIITNFCFFAVLFYIDTTPLSPTYIHKHAHAHTHTYTCTHGTNTHTHTTHTCACVFCACVHSHPYTPIYTHTHPTRPLL
jgi:hypothetical protein